MDSFSHEYPGDREVGAPDELGDPQVDDMVDDLGEIVFKARGEAIIVPTERMPTRSGIAAIFRF